MLSDNEVASLIAASAVMDSTPVKVPALTKTLLSYLSIYLRWVTWSNGLSESSKVELRRYSLKPSRLQSYLIRSNRMCSLLSEDNGIRHVARIPFLLMSCLPPPKACRARKDRNDERYQETGN